MSRYSRTAVQKSKTDNVRNKSFKKYNTTIYNEIPQTNTDIYVISQQGDRLDLLAQQFYGSTSLWWFIAQANNISTMNLEPGTSLRIPSSIKFAQGS